MLVGTACHDDGGLLGAASMGWSLHRPGEVDLQVHDKGQDAEACDDERYKSYVEPVPF